MKKIIVIIALTLASLFCSAGGRGVQSGKLASVISEYRGSDGFEVVRVGWLGTAAIKTNSRIALSHSGLMEQ